MLVNQSLYVGDIRAEIQRIETVDLMTMAPDGSDVIIQLNDVIHVEDFHINIVNTVQAQRASLYWNQRLEVLENLYDMPVCCIQRIDHHYIIEYRPLDDIQCSAFATQKEIAMSRTAVCWHQ